MQNLLIDTHERTCTRVHTHTHTHTHKHSLMFVHVCEQLMQALRRWRHAERRPITVNAVIFGDDPKGVRFMQDMAAAGGGR
jgi:hypothetical protein